MQKAEGLSGENSQVTCKNQQQCGPEKKQKYGWKGGAVQECYNIMQNFQGSTELFKVQSMTIDGSGAAE